MEKFYDIKPNPYCTHITHPSHYKASQYIQILDHDNLQIFLSFIFHDKATPTVTSLAPCQTSLQENHVGNAHDNLQLRHQLLHSKSQNLEVNSFQVF